MSLKSNLAIEIIRLLCECVSPTPLAMDTPGYCQHEFPETRKMGLICWAQHRTQGEFFMSPRAYARVSGNKGSAFRGNDHVFALRKLRFPWGDFVLLDDRNNLQHQSCYAVVNQQRQQMPLPR